MHFRATLLHGIWIIILGLLISRSALAAGRESCARIVSLAPSLTEIVFALELGDNLVGVTRYCSYPEAAKRIPKVGGFLDLSVEMVVSLKPTLVLGLNEHGVRLKQFNALNIHSEQFEHRYLKGILDSIIELGELCGTSEQAKRLRASLEQQIDHVSQLVVGLPQKSVLVVVGSDAGLQNLYISGDDGLYRELIEKAGGRPVFRETTAAAPSLSREGLQFLDPDVILHVVTLPLADPQGWQDRLLTEWRKIRALRAVATDRVFVLSQDYASIPGPRFPVLLHDIARILHPEAVR